MKNFRNLAILAAIFVTGSVHAETVVLKNAGSIDSKIVDAMAQDLQASYVPNTGKPADCKAIKLDRMGELGEGEHRDVLCMPGRHAGSPSFIWGTGFQRLKSGAYINQRPFVRMVTRGEVIDLKKIHELDQEKRVAVMEALIGAGETAYDTRGKDSADSLIPTALLLIGKAY